MGYRFLSGVLIGMMQVGSDKLGRVPFDQSISALVSSGQCVLPLWLDNTVMAP